MPAAFFKPKSFHLQWHITERCNLKCRHCYFDPNFLENELSKEQLFQAFRQYLALIGKWGLSRENNRISISGGEPLAREDLFDLLEEFRKHGNKTRYSLMTNGTMVDRETARKIREAGVSDVQVSLEGLGKANDAIRGEKSFERAERGIKALISEGHNVSVSMTLTKANLDEVPKMAEYCLNAGIGILGLRRFVPLGRGEEMRKALLEPEQVKKLYQYVFRKNYELREKASSLRIELGCEDGILAQNMHYNPKGCSAGYLSFTLLPNGDIYPCRRLPILLGNVLKESLWGIYYNAEQSEKLRNLNNASKLCRQCPYWLECRGGAKCSSYGYFGDAFSPDPQCWRLFERLPKEEFKPEMARKTALNNELIEGFKDD